ncbi:hypothetical protein [Fodinicurvata sp. EGI_FJ10296]|uniref:hypothetical protein n=1 Tax=Fodinicurvata sp. EGI_FJ10296 TaxID=3231908 RepID=UPI0034572B67
MTDQGAAGDRPPKKAGAGRPEDEARVTDLEFSGADVVIVESPDGLRSVVKGRELVDAADANADVSPGRETVKVMTVRCDRWTEVALILARMGH